MVYKWPQGILHNDARECQRTFFNTASTQDTANILKEHVIMEAVLMLSLVFHIFDTFVIDYRSLNCVISTLYSSS